MKNNGILLTVSGGKVLEKNQICGLNQKKNLNLQWHNTKFETIIKSGCSPRFEDQRRKTITTEKRGLW